MLDFFISIWLKFFFLLTPFFAVTVFLAMTSSMSLRQRHLLAVKTTSAVIIICLILFYFGNYIFHIFGITVNAFRIGAGTILFLNAVKLVNGSGTTAGLTVDADSDISVVPMALPFIVGPGTIGALLVMGTETKTARLCLIASGALIAAILTTGILLYISVWIEKVIGKRGLNVMSKISGLILAALAAQIIFTGIKAFLHL